MNYIKEMNPYTESAFLRPDENDDSIFYATDRFVSHIDSTALKTISDAIGSLVTEESPVILDMMAGWDSHLPALLKPGKVYGLGLNENELKNNNALDEYILHDLNKKPRLPYNDDTFDVVLNTVSVEYITQPFKVFEETGRILKPGGVFIVSFSDRMFESKAVRIWRQAGEKERIMIVEDYFNAAGIFTDPRLFVSIGKPRPQDDKYASLDIPSDPVFIMYAEKKGGNEGRQRADLREISAGKHHHAEPDSKELAASHKCPYCGQVMRKCSVQDSALFSDWDSEYLYICFNNECPYFVEGWDYMFYQGNGITSYRFCFDPANGAAYPIPAKTYNAMRESIIE